MSDGDALRVLMVGPARDARGGMASVVNGYYEAGLQDLCDLEYVETTSNGGALSKALKAALAMRDFARLLPSCDIVHVHLGAGVSFERKKAFVRKAKAAGKFIVLHEHRGILMGLLEDGGELVRKRNRELISLVDAVVVLSEEWRDFYVRHLCSEEKVFVLHNSVKVREGSLFSFSSSRVLFLGHMTDVKGPDVLVRAVPLVLESVPRARFVFAGDGDTTAYESLAAELGVSHACVFAGWVESDAKQRIMEGATVYCQPSRSEGMPMALLEAMSCGVPPVATAVGGTPQVVRDGLDGFLVPAEDPHALADRLIALLSDEKLAASIALAAKSRVEDQFNSKKELGNLIELYDSLIAHGKAGS